MTYHVPQLVILSLVAAFFAACAPAYRYALPQEAGITSASAVVEATQEELEARIVASQAAAATGGGLLFAFVDTAINNKRVEEAEATVAGLRDVLVDYDFHEKLIAKFDAAFTANSGFAFDDIRAVRLDRAGSKTLNDAINKVDDSDLVVYIGPEYAVRDEMRQLEVVLNVIVLDKSGAYKELISEQKPKRAKFLPNALYRNTLLAIVDFEGLDEGDMKKNAPMLINDNGALVKQALDLAIEESIALLAYDLNQGDHKDLPNFGNKRFKYDVSMSGKIEIQKVSHAWVRTNEGKLWSVGLSVE